MRIQLLQASIALLVIMNMNDHLANLTYGQEIVAHRGASHEAPENTLAAFRLAWELGADAIEGDFHLTRDGQIVCIHDKSTGKVADEDRKVADSTLAELRRLDVGSWKAAKYAGERIPTLAEVLEIVPEGKKILIEIKCGSEIIPALRLALAASDLDQDQVTVICFSSPVLTAVRAALPDIKTLWLTGYEQDETTGRMSPDLTTILRILADCDANGLDTQCEFAVLNREFIQSLRDAKYEVHTWTVNDSTPARQLKSLGIDSITTDVPDRIRAALEAK